VPIRLRLALASALATTVLLTIAGSFLYWRLAGELSRSLNQELRQRAADLSVVVGSPGRPLAGEAGSGLVERGEDFAEFVAADGRVLESTATLHNASLLTPDELAVARRGPLWLDRPSVPGLDERARLLATPTKRGADQVVIVVGATLENRAEALRILRTEMLVAGPITILAVTFGGYLLAGGALRPVEAMRRQAAAFEPGQRLPLASSHDELTRLGETLNAMLSRLEDALESERRFVADASHELRTPLAMLRTELELALRHPRTADELRQAIRSAVEEADRLGVIAADLLTIAQADDRALPRAVGLDAGEIAADAARPLQVKAATLGRTLTVEASDGLVVRADPPQLRQALHNMLDNALEHGDGAVCLRAVRVGGAAEFHVTDEGSGFPSEFLPRAFGRFSRADPTGASGGGAGLGLSIVAAIARRHGGAARAVNRPGGGADVSISLPCDAATTAVPQQ
jgi:two-component system OmpR family sensor kinase